MLITAGAGYVDPAFASQVHADPHLPGTLRLLPGDGSGGCDAPVSVFRAGCPLEFFVPFFLFEQGIDPLPIVLPPASSIC